jgi:hypothetical protein
MKSIVLRRAVISVVAFAALSATSYMAQSPTQMQLPKIDEPSLIAIAYNREGRGKISAANSRGRVNQYLEVWENKSKIPNVVTYVFVGDDRQTFFSATWGKGPVNTDAFSCKAIEIPEFREKSFWVVTVTDGVLTFTEIQDGDVKGLFENLAKTRRDWDLEVNAESQKRNANTTQSNLLSFVKKKNREKWLQLGWLQLVTSCVRHF